MSRSDDDTLHFRSEEGRGFMLLPPAPGLCAQCAMEHEPEQPHNPGSLFWQVQAKIAGLPDPTWDIALAHCPDDVFEWWREMLFKVGGLTVTPRD